MREKPVKILGLNPGSKYLGIAVFNGPELRDWRIKVIKGRWSKKKMQKAVSTLLDFTERNEVMVIAIKKLHSSRSSPGLNRLVGNIKNLGKRRGLKVYQYSIQDIKDFYSPEKINKKKLAEIIASNYPVLFHELNKENSHGNPYYIRMFEAVALGAVCFQHLDKR